MYCILAGFAISIAIRLVRLYAIKEMAMWTGLLSRRAFNKAKRKSKSLLTYTKETVNKKI